MSLKPQTIGPVPTETARIARAAYPKGTRYLQLRDRLGTIYRDEDFAALFPKDGQPAYAPWRLALVTVLQFLENLSDRQAADAVRGRLDWKYLLGLELSDPGFDASVLVEFRQRLLAGEQELLLFDVLLLRLQEEGLVKARGRQRSDSTHVLARVRALNRLEQVGETFRATLNSLAVAAPEWLEGQVQDAWVKRYDLPVNDARLPSLKQDREAYALLVGKDGVALLDAIDAPEAPRWLREIPAVQTLRRVWIQRFYWEEGELRWRDLQNSPAAGDCLDSPYDPEAHYAHKRDIGWLGYKVHLTETCDEELPHLITHVETTPAPQVDEKAVAPIHEALLQRKMLPQRHLVDTGYVEARTLAASQDQYGVDLFGPSRGDYHWQARVQAGFATDQFQVDWDAHQAICPQGKVSSSWSPARDDHGHPVMKITFATQDCRGCPSRPQCTRSQARSPRRVLTVHPEPQYRALQAARERETTPAFRAAYAQRAGIEGTLSQGVRAFGLRQARYFGQAKVHLQHLCIATAMNLVRMDAWLTEQPRAHTRQAPFVRLVKQRV